MFNPRKQQPNDPIHILDPVTTSTEKLEPPNFGFQRLEKHENRTNIDDGAESGVFSPPLWQNSPPRSSMIHPVNNYRSLSPNSRAQAIARGQWELMEMVKNMPESCYELSLKDLVEQPTTTTTTTKVFESQEECLINKEKNQVFQNRVKIKRQESNNKKNDQKRAKMMRSRSIENGGLFLKMGFPISLRSKKKKKSSVNITKVSPKPEESENTSRSVEKDWWKKRFSSSSGSSGSSSNSGSTARSTSCGSSARSSTSSRNNNNRKREGVLTSCWSRLCFSNTKSAG